jgi:hypothetical protein
MYSFNYSYENSILFISYASQKDIDDMVFPENVEDIIITGDHIDHLKIPDGVESVTCGKMGLKTIFLPDSVRFFYCANNLLKNIELPQDIILVDIDNNYLETITFRNGDPTQLEVFRLNENLRIHTLDFVPPETLDEICLKKCGGIRHLNEKLAKKINSSLTC